MKPEPAIYVPAAWALGRAASIKVASHRMTSTERGVAPGSIAGQVRSLPATDTEGNRPCRATIAAHAWPAPPRGAQRGSTGDPPKAETARDEPRETV